VNLAADTIYTVCATTNILTVQNTTLKSNIIWSFKTMPLISRPVSVYPVDGSKNIDIDTSVSAAFNVNLLSETCSENIFKLFEGGTNGIEIDADVSPDSDPKKFG